MAEKDDKKVKKENDDKNKKEIAEAQGKVKGKEKEDKDRQEEPEKKEKGAGEGDSLESFLPEDVEGRQAKISKDYDLEELAREKIDLPLEVLESQYAEQLSREPIGDIYKEMGNIYKTVEEKGYISREEEKRVEYLSSAVERKLEAEGSGSYSFSEQAARAASITKHMGASLINSYKSGHKSSLYRSS